MMLEEIIEESKGKNRLYNEIKHIGEPKFLEPPALTSSDIERLKSLYSPEVLIYEKLGIYVSKGIQEI